MSDTVVHLDQGLARFDRDETLLELTSRDGGKWRGGRYAPRSGINPMEA